MPKYVVVTGGVLSGLGKGVFTASLARLLKACGFKVVPIKFDGYLNVDAGTMNPYRHGEVFVLEDGTECDMDLGTYERFLDMNLGWWNNPTGGKIFKGIIEKERRGEYLGRDVQFVPHVTDFVKDWIKKVARDFKAEITLIEVGGTVGDIENSYFIEALRQLAYEEGRENVMFIHVTLVPVLSTTGEQKTKPTQHSVKMLMQLGVVPDMIAVRCVEPISEGTREKIALYCNVPKEGVVDVHDMNIYEVPLWLKRQRVHEFVLKRLRLKERKKPKLELWAKLVRSMKNARKVVRVGIAGKYVQLKDAYVSVVEALRISCAHLGIKPEVVWVDTEGVERGLDLDGLGLEGLIVPGGFGKRGFEGKVMCVEWARKRKKPFLGLCFGMQAMVVEWARNVLGLKGANSTEIDPKTEHPVIDLLPEQRTIRWYGGTMRLGAFACRLKPGTKAFEAYKSEVIYERHRHRYEVNPNYVRMLEESGLIVSGTNPESGVVEIVEWPSHPFGVGIQAHPEFKARFEKPAPLFTAFVKACLKRKG